MRGIPECCEESLAFYMMQRCLESGKNFFSGLHSLAEGNSHKGEEWVLTFLSQPESYIYAAVDVWWKEPQQGNATAGKCHSSEKPQQRP